MPDATPINDWTAALDQAQCKLVPVAKALGAYRAALIAVGFSEAHALDLCLEVQEMFIFGDRRDADS